MFKRVVDLKTIKLKLCSCHNPIKPILKVLIKENFEINNFLLNDAI